METLQFVSRLGAGSYAIVYKARAPDGSFVAVKELKQAGITMDELLNQNEVKVLRRAGAQENITGLRSASVIGGKGYLVMDLAEGSLLSMLVDASSKGKMLSEAEIRSIMRDILKGLGHLHGRGLLHRDIKPENILLSRSSSGNGSSSNSFSIGGGAGGSSSRTICKLCDFGQATVTDRRPPLTTYVATRWYRAPELLLRAEDYGPGVDVWAAGCLMAELYLLRPLFPGTSEQDQLFRILSCVGSAGARDAVKRANIVGYSLPSIVKPLGLHEGVPNASRDALQVLDAMFQIDPTKRAPACDILKMPFFASQGADALLKYIEPVRSAADDAASRAAASEAQAIFLTTLAAERQREKNSAAAGMLLPSATGMSKAPTIGVSDGNRKGGMGGTYSGNESDDDDKDNDGKGVPESKFSDKHNNKNVGGTSSSQSVNANRGPQNIDSSRGSISSSSTTGSGSYASSATTLTSASSAAAAAARRRVATNPFAELGSSTTGTTTTNNTSDITGNNNNNINNRTNTTFASSGNATNSFYSSRENSFGTGKQDDSDEEEGVLSRNVKSSSGAGGGTAPTTRPLVGASDESTGVVGLGLLQNTRRKPMGGGVGGSSSSSSSRGAEMAALFGGMTIEKDTTTNSGYIASAPKR